MAKKTKKPLNAQEKRLKKIIQQIAGDVESIDGELIPRATIKGTGAMYCYSHSSREFVHVSRGITVYVIDMLKDDKVLIYTITGFLLEIDSDELVSLGFD
jgi:hypothetical protein